MKKNFTTIISIAIIIIVFVITGIIAVVIIQSIPAPAMPAGCKELTFEQRIEITHIRVEKIDNFLGK